MPRIKSNASAVEGTIKALRKSERITEADEALVTLCRRLAAACDETPGNAALWREYRGAVASLMEVGADGGDVDEAAEFASQVRSKMGDGAKS